MLTFHGIIIHWQAEQGRSSQQTLPLGQSSNPSHGSCSSTLHKEKPYQGRVTVPWLVSKTPAEDVGAHFPPGAEGFDPRVGSPHEAMA